MYVYKLGGKNGSYSVVACTRHDEMETPSVLALFLDVPQILTYLLFAFIPEDYLPLIAGLVAVTVIIISVVFVFIYSIYYKNTKMRNYSLKNPKLNTQNGNVAHNGWESQFPMTKLS